MREKTAEDTHERGSGNARTAAEARVKPRGDVTLVGFRERPTQSERKNKQKDMSYVRRLRLRRCADALPSLELFLVAFEAGVGSDKWVPGAYAQGGESVCWQGGCARNKLSWMEIYIYRYTYIHIHTYI